MIKVLDEKGLQRDPNSKAILQTDVVQLTEHRRRKTLMKKMIEDTSKVKSLEEKLNQQDKEIAELKQLINSIISQNK